MLATIIVLFVIGLYILWIINRYPSCISSSGSIISVYISLLYSLNCHFLRFSLNRCVTVPEFSPECSHNYLCDLIKSPRSSMDHSYSINSIHMPLHTPYARSSALRANGRPPNYCLIKLPTQRRYLLAEIGRSRNDSIR